jgi:hypothetical protein
MRHTATLPKLRARSAAAPAGTALPQRARQKRQPRHGQHATLHRALTAPTNGRPGLRRNAWGPASSKELLATRDDLGADAARRSTAQE